MAIERDIIAGCGAPDTGRPASAIGPSAATRRAIAVIIGLAVFLVLTVCVSLMLGRYPIGPLQALAMLVDQIPGISIEQLRMRTWGCLTAARTRSKPTTSRSSSR